MSMIGLKREMSNMFDKILFVKNDIHLLLSYLEKEDIRDEFVDGRLNDCIQILDRILYKENM